MQPTLHQIPLASLTSGDTLFLQAYQFRGQQPGKKVYIQSNLHGAEIAGNAVIYELIEFLRSLASDQLTGEIWLVPLCNPLGSNQRTHHFSSGRFNPYDGKDWNRIFWDYEQEGEDLDDFAERHLEDDPLTLQQQYRQCIAEAFGQIKEAIASPQGVPFRELYRYRLQSLCLDADYLIDLHSSSNQGTNYLYYFAQREESARLFLLPAGILLDNYDGDAFDEAFIKPWLALEQRLAERGRPIQFDIEAWTLELGSGLRIQPESVAKGVRGIKNYLAAKQVLALPDFPVDVPSYHDLRFTTSSKLARYYAPEGGLVQPLVSLGALVDAGQPLYRLLSFDKRQPQPQAIVVEAEHTGLVFDMAMNQAVNQGEYVLGIL
ncbi:MAG: succinylglutamate desuccinylase/aspartoacylase family protein [Cyanobacteria bacterium P01_A01_bin.135]